MTNQEFLAAVRVHAFRAKVRAKRAIAKQMKKSARKNRLAIRRIKVLAIIFFVVILCVRPGILETATAAIALIAMLSVRMTMPKGFAKANAHKPKARKSLARTRPNPKQTP